MILTRGRTVPRWMIRKPIGVDAVEGYDETHPWVNGLYEKYEGRWSSLLGNSLYTHIKSRRFSHMTITRDSHGSVCIVNRRRYKKDKTLAEGNSMVFHLNFKHRQFSKLQRQKCLLSTASTKMGSEAEKLVTIQRIRNICHLCPSSPLL